MKTEITKIKLQLKDREIELTATEARDVQKELNRLFEVEKTELQKFKEEWEKTNPKTPAFPYPVYLTPIIIERERFPFYPYRWEITCDTPTQTIGVCTSATLCMAVGKTE